MRLFRAVMSGIGLFLFLSLPSFAGNTATVAGSVKDIFNATDSSQQICFTLRDTRADNSGSYQTPVNPRVSGVGVISNYTGNCVSATAGSYSITPYANDVITTQNGQATVWAVTLKSKHGGETTLGTYRFTANNTYDLSVATPLSTVPAVTAPTGDTTYLRLDGGNIASLITTLAIPHNVTISGTTTLNGGVLNGTYTGNPTLSGNVAVTGAASFNEVTSRFFICPLTDPLGLTDSSVLFQNCYNLAYPKGEEVIIPNGKFLLNTAQNWTNKPGAKISGVSSQFQLSSQSPINGGGASILLCNTGAVCLDTTGSSDIHLKDFSVYLAGTGIATPSTVGILQGRDNAAGGGNGAFCFAEKFVIDNVNIIDYSNNTTGRGYIGIANIGAENGTYKNFGIHTATPMVLAKTNFIPLTSPYQTLATGCPNFMTEISMDNVLLDSFTAATPNIEASGTYSIHGKDMEFIGGNAAILFEGATTGNWDISGAQESLIGPGYFMRSTVNVIDSRFHIESGPSDYINPEANNLTFQNNDFMFNTELSAAPLITNTATGTTIAGGRAVISGTTSASNTTVKGTQILAPTVANGNITFNAASNYEYSGVSGLITVGQRLFSPGTVALPGIAFVGAIDTGWSYDSANGLLRPSIAGLSDWYLRTTDGQFSFGSTGHLSFHSSVDPLNSAPDVGLARNAAGIFEVNNGVPGNSAGRMKTAAVVSGGAAAGLTGTGACATFSTQTGGSMAGRATCTGTTGASTLTITPGTTAPNGWVCNVQDQTTRANLLQQTSNTTTACTLTATSVTQNDVFVFTAIAF